MKEYKLYINGEWVEGGTGEYFSSFNKATGEAVNKFSISSSEDVDLACQAARKAFPVWSGMDGETRSDYMRKAAEIMKRRRREMAEVESMETGKPVFDAYDFDVRVSIWAFEYFADLCREIRGEVVPVGDINQRDFDFVTYEPYGVAAIIAPFNFPIHLLTRSLAPALAAGNTCVIKASSFTPTTAAMMAEVFEEAGFPKGVVNLVQGPGSTVGNELVSHKEIDIVGFTGSEAVGRQLMRLSSESPVIKKLVLELGGKGGVIVMPDADIDIATTCQIEGFTFNQGEVCCAMTRVILHEDVYDDYLKMLKEKIDAIKIGHPQDEETRMGVIYSKEHVKEIEADIAKAVEQGGKIYTGGVSPQIEGLPDDAPFFLPTVITDVTPDMEIWQKEVFGPVLCVCKYTDLEKAVELCNSTDFGLGANIFTKDYVQAYKIGQRLNAGSVWVNLPNGMHMACPFGGNKNSGSGREYGTYGLHEYLKIKNNMWRMH